MTDPKATSAQSPDAADRPYQVMVFVGAPGEVPPPVEGVRMVDLTLAAGADPYMAVAPDQHPMVVRLRESGLTPADLRSKVLVLLSPTTDAASAMLAYSVMSGFAARRVDVARIDAKIDAEELDAVFRRISDPGRPETVDEMLQLGADHESIASIAFDDMTDPAIALRVRYARRLRIVAADSVLDSVRYLVQAAALRARDKADRFPTLVRGDEPAFLPATPAAVVSESGPVDLTGFAAPQPGTAAELAAPVPAEPAGVDLDDLRRVAHDMRRTLRFEDRSALAEPVDPTARQLMLLAAAELPVASVMTALGASTPDGNLWHCPRPDRHRNGDANASMRVDAGKVRCFRCDAEKVDGVRLVADVKSCSFDEAAAWLLANIAPAPAELAPPVLPAV